MCYGWRECHLPGERSLPPELWIAPTARASRRARGAACPLASMLRRRSAPVSMHEDLRADSAPHVRVYAARGRGREVLRQDAARVPVHSLSIEVQRSSCMRRLAAGWHHSDRDARRVMGCDCDTGAYAPQ